MPVKAPTFRPKQFGTIRRIRDDRAYDAARGSARERGYDNKWDKARKTFLSHRPDCVMCGGSATVVDHKQPHLGDQQVFWDQDNWQPLCVGCHSGRKQSQERLGADGQRRAIPFDIKLSRIPVSLVCGPAGAGKSTFVEKHAWATDIIIDLDVIRSRIASTPIHQPSPEFTRQALDERNRILRSLASDRDHTRAWFVIAAPQREVRESWARKLGAFEVIVLDTPLEECIRRIRADRRREGQYERMEQFARDWWRRFTP